MVRRICEITVTLDFIFLFVHCSNEDVSFNSIYLHQAVLLVNVVQETRLEKPFKGNNVKALVKTSNCENLVLHFPEKVQKIAAFAMLFWFSVTKQSFENVAASPNDQKYRCYPLVLKLNVTFN